jgi:alkylated DNA repair dioxygenase AlkB
VRDLFDDDAEFITLSMEGADVSYLPQLPIHLSNEKVFNTLYAETKWQHEQVVVWGKSHFQPRLTAWYGDPGKSYTYSGTVMFPLPWTNLLLSLRREVERVTQFAFNSVLLNLYRDENDRMGFHSDNEPSLGPEPVIASLSFGEVRTLVFKHKRDKAVKNKSLSLPDGSLLLMKGKTQINWAHGINKESRKCGPRINLTFRQIFK